MYFSRKKTTNLLIVTCVIISIISCEPVSDLDTSPRPLNYQLSIARLDLHDYGNEGNSKDIRFDISAYYEHLGYSTFRAILTKSSVELTLDEALNLQEGAYFETYAASYQETFASEPFTDSDGDAIVEGQEYVAYVLAIPHDEEIEPYLNFKSFPITLKNEIAVFTPHLTGINFGAEDIEIEANGTIYISGSDEYPDNLFKVTEFGEVVSFGEGLHNPLGLCMNNNGELLVSNFVSLDLHLISPNGETSIYNSDSCFISGRDIAIDAYDTLFLSAGSKDSVYKVTRDTIMHFELNPQIEHPTGIVYDEVNDEFIIANTWTGQIYAASRSGDVSEIIDLDVYIGYLDVYGDQIFTTSYENKVLIIARDGSSVEEIGGSVRASIDGDIHYANFLDPKGIKITPDGKYAYVTEQHSFRQSNALRKIALRRR